MNLQGDSKIKSLFNEYGALLMFILWPFWGFIIACFNFRNTLSKTIIILFFILYGFTIVNDQIGFDLYTNSLAFRKFVSLPNSYFFELFTNLFKEDKNLDIFQSLLAFSISRITNNEKVLFAIYSLVFSLLYIKGLSLLYRGEKNNNLVNIIYLFIISLYPVTSIGNFRFFSAIWIFFIGAYYVIYLKNYKYLFVCLMAMLMHFGLGVANVLLILYLLIGNKNIVYISLVIASFILPSFFDSYIISFSNKLGGGFEDKVGMYLNEEYVSIIQSQSFAWFLTARQQFLNIYLFIVMTVSYILHYKSSNIKLNNYFQFSLLLLSFSNFTINVPSLGSRYMGIFQLFAFTFFYLFSLNIDKKKINFWITLGLLPLVLHLLIMLRFASDTINIWLLAPTPLPFAGDEVSIWSLIEQIF